MALKSLMEALIVYQLHLQKALKLFVSLKVSLSYSSRIFLNSSNPFSAMGSKKSISKLWVLGQAEATFETIELSRTALQHVSEYFCCLLVHRLVLTDNSVATFIKSQ
jgi:hypothetical protein